MDLVCQNMVARPAIIHDADYKLGHVVIVVGHWFHTLHAYYFTYYDIGICDYMCIILG